MWMIDHKTDYEGLIATVQRHTESKACLKDLGDGTKVCCFHFPKALQNETKLKVCLYSLLEPSADTKRNDPRIIYNFMVGELTLICKFA